MSCLVLELQKDAMDKSVDTSELLRKAMVVSRKLNISEIQDWINSELNGYTSIENEIPEYRMVTGELKIRNPYHGLQPLHCQDAEMGEDLSKRVIGQSICELDSLVKSNGTHLQVPFSQSTKNYLMSRMEIPLEPTLVVGSSQLHKILESVRNEVLNWALDLESKGIIGNGMSFSPEEKNAASQISYHVTNNIGSMDNSQLQQDSPNATQTMLIT